VSAVYENTPANNLSLRTKQTATIGTNMTCARLSNFFSFLNTLYRLLVIIINGSVCLIFLFISHKNWPFGAIFKYQQRQKIHAKTILALFVVFLTKLLLFVKLKFIFYFYHQRIIMLVALFKITGNATERGLVIG
jgi:hypothetical protein